MTAIRFISVYDLGSYNHQYYLTMEFLPGGTLEQKIKIGTSPAQALQLIKTICRSVSFAHTCGVIHRDIKPQNILFRNADVPVLTDLGIARLMHSDPGLTIPGRAVGSPLYMSPEQICGCKIDERADLYAIGILFYQMLTKKLHAIGERNNSADNATEPLIELLAGTRKAGPNANAKGDGHTNSNQSNRKINQPSSGPRKSIATWKTRSIVHEILSFLILSGSHLERLSFVPVNVKL